MTQTELVVQVIASTLYSDQRWIMNAVAIDKKIEVYSAWTLVGNKVVKLNFDEHKIIVNKKRYRVSKELSTDLFEIVKLVIRKSIKKYEIHNS
jgi:hypothetical protein